MEKLNEIKVPIIYYGSDKWLNLNHLSNTGKLRAARISKVRQVHDPDSHHCGEVSVQTSIRFNPKKWKIN